ncbi:MAG: hypothetical protein ACFE75_04740 [Candidatus Hodarchaeota archaeon]
MPNKKRNYSIIKIKIFLSFLTVSIVLIPLFLGGVRFSPNSAIYESIPKMGDFSKDDYNPILTEEEHALGNITINDIDFSKLEMGFYIYNEIYPLIWEDYESDALNISRINIKFINTTEPAIRENLNPEITDRNFITVKLNESLEVRYNNSQAGYLIYHPRLRPSRLIGLFIENNTDIIELVAGSDYIIDTNDFLVFYYKNYFQKGPTYNFSMHIIWEYEIYVQFWSLDQFSGADLIMNEIEQNFTAKYNYDFTLTGRKFGQTISENLIADNIYVALTVNLPDKNSLNEHNLELNNETVNIITHLNLDKSIDIYLSDFFSANSSEFSLNFTASFTLKFVDPVGDTWAIDRLVAERSIRERIYFPSLINGPKHIYLKHISFYEPTIYFDQLIKDQFGKLFSNYSLFERNFALFQLNTSATGKKGLQVFVPYLIVGETCPFVIKYKTFQNLKVIITDNIKMPLVGANLEIFYFGQKFGTYISNNRVQPIPAGPTNEGGEIVLSNVPHGNYTIRVYHSGEFLIESATSTYNVVNYIYTDYPHFPLWILIFGIINGIILIIGVVFYLKYRKSR